MRRPLRVTAPTVLLTVLLVAPAGAATVPATGTGHEGARADAAEAGDHDTDRVVVRFADKRRSGGGHAEQLRRQATAQATVELPRLGAEAWTVPAGQGERVAEQLEADPFVAWAEVDPRVAIADEQPDDEPDDDADNDEGDEPDEVEPNDPRWVAQGGMRRIGAHRAWATSTGSPSVRIAIVDTGVSPHADLGDALLAGYNVLDRSRDATDPHGHGTAVAGLAAARGDNDRGIAGMCWECRIMPVRALDATGRGFMADVAEGLAWSVDAGADIVNLSLGGAEDSRSMREAVTYAAANGVLVVAAAGNSGTSKQFYPAASERVIGVAGILADGSRPNGSNYGSWADVAAPWCNTALWRPTSGSPEPYRDDFCGTSSAAPLVAGAAGLALSVAPGATGADLRDIVTGTAGHATFVDTGLIDASRIVREIDPEGPPTSACRERASVTSFHDVDPDSVHAAAVACAVAHGITAGFSDGTYRPAIHIRRDQMATFIAETVRAAGGRLPEPQRYRFDDLYHPCRDGAGNRTTCTNPHQRSIEQLALVGVVSGATRSRYDPAEPVTRAQMATFLAGAHEVVTGRALATSARHFEDISGTTHRANIDALAEAGVLHGLAPRRYGPEQRVRRDGMASFVVGELDLLARRGHLAEAR